MGFFDALRKALGHHDADSATEEAKQRLNSVWGLGVDSEVRAAVPEGFTDASAYDRANWRKKLKRILDELPESRTQWDELQAEAQSLSFDPQWVKTCESEEFLLLIRRAVSDRRLTVAEHRKLDLARVLIGLDEAEAEASVHAIMAEAAQFFGKPVREEG